MKHLLLLFVGLVAFKGLAQPNYTQKLNEFMQAQVDAKRFNGTVLVAKNGDIIYQKAFGYANYDTKAPLDLNSLFDLASVSKQFTAMSILLLKEQGKLSLSDSLRKFFPELPYAGITIQQLLTHTSGLPDYMDAMMPTWNHKKVAFNADMIQFLAQNKTPALFQPGQKWEYSNTGYAMLASIVEKVSGQSLAQFTAQRIFKPLGMSRSRIYNTRRSTNEVIPNYAYGYVYADSLKRYILPDSLLQFDFVSYLEGIIGDGVVNSTVGDLLKWDRALKNHTLLPEAIQQEMLTGQALMDTLNKSYYGYGMIVGKRDNRDYVAHSGGWPGYTTYLVRYLEDDLTIIALSNNMSATASISNTLADIMFGKPVTLPQKRVEIQVNKKILESYVGVYEVSPGREFTVKLQGDQLLIKLGNQEYLYAYPESEAKFFYRAVDAQVAFFKNEKNEVEKLILYQNGRELPAKRK